VNVGLPHFLTVGAVLFALGLFAVMSRRNTVAILMGVEWRSRAMCNAGSTAR
jgi:NADH-quinone oxidoreductase subunit K